MPRISLSRAARVDLSQIWEYIASDDAVAADRMLHQFDRAVQLLVERPAIGQPRPQFSMTMRSFLVGRYIIFYEPTAHGIHVFRELHGARFVDFLK